MEEEEEEEEKDEEKKEKEKEKNEAGSEEVCRGDGVTWWRDEEKKLE
jgi:hypothetical protein